MLERFAQLCIVALALLGAVPVAAAEQPAFYDSTTVVARPIATATEAVTVLDRDEIEALDVVSVAELIRFIPGLDVTSSGPRGGVATAQIRGGDPNFTVVLIDGVPLNDSTDPLGGAVNLNSLPVAQIERIEIVRGPLSSFLGSTGLSGAINIVTRRAPEGAGAPHGAAALAAGSASSIQSAASIAGRGERGDHFVGATWEREEDRIVEDRFDQLALQGNVRSVIGDRSALQVAGRLTTWEAEDYQEGSGGILGTGETRTSEHDELSLGVQWEFGDEQRRQKLFTTLYRHELERESPGIPAGAFSVPPAVENTRYTRIQLGWLSPVLETPTNRLVVGLEAGKESGTNDATLDLGFPLDGSYDVDRVMGAASAEWIAQRGRFVFEAGARADKPQGFDLSLSPRAGIAYRFEGDALRLRLSVGRAFKLPSFNALASPPQLGGNAQLEPEVAWGGSVGVDYTPSALRVTASVFEYRYNELITFVFDPTMFGLVNLSEVRSRGAELGASFTPIESLTLQANVTRQDVEDRATGEPLRNRPEWTGGARVTWRVVPRLRWEVDAQWVSSSRDQQLPSARTEVDGYGIYGTAVTMTLSSQFALHARVDNLTDEDYETFIGFPGPDRSVRAGLRWQTPAPTH